MLKEQKNSRKQGDVGMGFAIAYFTTLGYCVSIPLTDSQSYDLVVEMEEGVLCKIQIKTTYRINKAENYEVLLKSCGGNKSTHLIRKFDNTKSDYLFVVTDNQTLYLIPTKNIHAKNALSLHKGMDIYKVKL